MKWYEKHWTSVSNSSAGRDILMIYISLGLFFTLLYKQTTTIHWAHHTKQISFIIQRVMIYYIYVSFPYPIFCFRQAGNCTKCSCFSVTVNGSSAFLPGVDLQCFTFSFSTCQQTFSFCCPSRLLFFELISCSSCFLPVVLLFYMPSSFQLLF